MYIDLDSCLYILIKDVPSIMFITLTKELSSKSLREIHSNANGRDFFNDLDILKSVTVRMLLRTHRLV